MGFRERLKSMSHQLNAKKSQLMSREFAHGSMAICALIAAADGSIDTVEKEKTAELIAGNEVLAVFDPDELRAIFNGYVAELESNYDLGKIELLRVITKLKGKPEQARAMIQLGIVIGGADGIFDPYEQAAVRKACNAIGIAPAEFGL
jgi:tellurite resistance protein TerB